MSYQIPPKIRFTEELRRFLLHHAIKNDQAGALLGKVKVLSALKLVEGTEYTCVCPWCGAEEGFIFDKKFGDCSCSSCSKNGDLVDLMLETSNLALGLESVMNIISVNLEMWGMP